MKRTDIEWTDLSSNPLQYRDGKGRVVWGCVKHSSGCANCYAEAIAERFERGGPFTRATMEGLTPFLSEEELWHILTAQKIDKQPVAGKRCFLGDMTDIFGEWVPDELLDRLFAALAMRRNVTFQILTKRADRMAAYFNTPNRRRLIAEQVMPLSNMLASAAGTHTKRLKMNDFEAAFLSPGPFANLWLGVSVENQAAADERIPHLLNAPAAVRFLSCEPLLGAVDLRRYLPNTFTGFPRGPRISWVIVGGESGHGARPMQIEWARALVGQCKAASVPCFVKQLGSDPRWAPKSGGCGIWPDHVRFDYESRGEDSVHRIRLRDRKGGDPSEWPSDLQVREFPA